MSFQERITQAFQYIGIDIKKQRSMVHGAGRLYCEVTNQWKTDSDDNYGTQYYQFAEAAGTGVDPVVEWEHKGFLIPEGSNVCSLTIGGNTNNNEVTDIEISIMLKRPNPITRYETGFDADGEMENIEIYRDLLFNPVNGGNAFTGSSTDSMYRTIEIDHDVTELSQLSMYLKPIGTLTATRYFRFNYLYQLKQV